MPDPAGAVDSAHASDPTVLAPSTAPNAEAAPNAAAAPNAEAAPSAETAPNQGDVQAQPAARAQPAAQPRPERSSRLGLFLVAAALAVTADVVSKVLIVADLDPLEPRRLLGGAVYLVLTRNGGAAFSIGPGATIVFTVVAVVIAGLLVRVAGRLRSSGWAIALGLVLGGAVGNLVDRFARSPGFGRGHVVDWISLFADDGHIWPIFNLADSAIVVGGVLGAVLALRGVELDGHRGHRRPNDSHDAHDPDASAAQA